MSEWRFVKLGDIADEVTVAHVGPMASEYVPDGIPFLRSQNIVPHGFDMSDVKFIGRTFHEQLRKSSLRAGDVVTVRTGKPGTTAVVPESWVEANCADLVITRPGRRLDSRWLSYFINAAVSGFVASQLVGAVQQHFNVGAAKAMMLYLPELDEQQAIAEVLGALDDKIAANLTLEQHAEEYFRLLFAEATMDQCVQRSELFEAVSIDFGEPFAGSEFTEPGVGRQLIRIRDLKRFTCQTWTTESRPRETVIEPGDVLVGMDAEFRPTSWLGSSGVLNQRVCRVRSSLLGPVFVKESLIQPLLEIENAKTGTTVIHLNKADLIRITIPVPSFSAIERFRARVDPLYHLRIKLGEERRTLAATRDLLLPELMSGKLRVTDAEKQVEAVV